MTEEEFKKAKMEDILEELMFPETLCIRKAFLRHFGFARSVLISEILEQCHIKEIEGSFYQIKIEDLEATQFVCDNELEYELNCLQELGVLRMIEDNLIFEFDFNKLLEALCE